MSDSDEYQPNLESLPISPDALNAALVEIFDDRGWPSKDIDLADDINCLFGDNGHTMLLQLSLDSEDESLAIGTCCLHGFNSVQKKSINKWLRKDYNNTFLFSQFNVQEVDGKNYLWFCTGMPLSGFLTVDDELNDEFLLSQIDENINTHMDKLAKLKALIGYDKYLGPPGLE